jgi:hypothetical protein
MARYTQSLSPYVDQQLDCSQGTNLHPEDCPSAIMKGRSFLADSTREEDAVVQDDLVPRPNQVNAGSNFMASPYDCVSSVVEALAAVAMLATESYCYARQHRRHCSRKFAFRAVRHLFFQISAWVHGGADREPLLDPIHSTALLLLCAVYPVDHVVGEPMIDEGLAVAHGEVRRALLDDPACRGTDLRTVLVDRLQRPELLDDSTRFWAAFEREDVDKSAWPAVQAILEQIIVDDGRHDATSADRAHFRSLLDAVLRNGWRVASPDGVARPAKGPASEVGSAAKVSSPQIAPVFFTTEERDSRGGLCGMQRFQLRQLLALIAGGALVSRCQVVRNEGSIVAKTCAAADILQTNGERRARKGASCLQTDCDELGFGSDQSKLIATARNRRAYDENTRIEMEILAKIVPPLNDRWRGGMATGQRRRTGGDRLQPDSSSDIRARMAMRRAAASPLCDQAFAREKEILAPLVGE